MCRLDEMSSSFSSSLSESSGSVDIDKVEHSMTQLNTLLSAGTQPLHGDRVPSCDTVSETGSQSPGLITDNTSVSRVPADRTQPLSSTVPSDAAGSQVQTVITEAGTGSSDCNEMSEVIELGDIEAGSKATREPAAQLTSRDHEAGTGKTQEAGTKSVNGGYGYSALVAVGTENGISSTTSCSREDLHHQTSTALPAEAHERLLNCGIAEPDDFIGQRMAFSVDTSATAHDQELTDAGLATHNHKLGHDETTKSDDFSDQRITLSTDDPDPGFHDQKFVDRGLASGDQELGDKKAEAAESDYSTDQRMTSSVDEALALRDQELRQEESAESDDLTDQTVASTVHAVSGRESSQEASVKSDDLTAQFQSLLRRHVRHQSEPVYSVPAAKTAASAAVSMETSSTTEQHQSSSSSSSSSSEQSRVNNSSSSKPVASSAAQHQLQQHKDATGSASLPSTPQYVSWSQSVVSRFISCRR